MSSLSGEQSRAARMEAAAATFTEPQGPPAPATLRVRLRAYVALTKPNIIWLLLITTVPAMVLAERGWPSTWLVVATLIGGALAAGGAHAMNNYADRDIDARMERTRHRPLPEHVVAPQQALWFGLVLGLLSAVWLTLTVNWLAAALAIGAMAFYVVIYTYMLKRTTVQNIVIGGAAGAAPPMIGWAAVTGNVGLEAVMLLLVVFFWTPPHFWALALILQDDYRRAGVPMLPVIYGVEETKRQILIYALALVPLTVVFGGVAGLSWLYLGVATVGGAGFILIAEQLRRTPGISLALRTFKYSIYYLTALFAAILLDVLLLG